MTTDASASAAAPRRAPAAPRTTWTAYWFGLVGERVYMLLSLFAKSALAWQVFAGTLQPA